MQIGFLERIYLLIRFNHDVCSDTQDLRWNQMVSNVASICVNIDITNQQLLDVELEIDRLIVLTAIQAASHMHEEHVAFSLNNINQLKYGKRICKDELVRMLANIRSIGKIGELLDVWKLNISQERSIPTRMGFAAEHWFKCSNGHVNPLDECTTQQVEPVCRECIKDNAEKETAIEVRPEKASTMNN